MFSKEFDYEVEKAICFAGDALRDASCLAKPVFLHSVRVGMRLYDEGRSEQVVLAGFLHDLLEDTEIVFTDLEKEFGSEVARIVQANTFDVSIKDKVEQYRELFVRCCATGKNAALVKAADILDNSVYYLIGKDGKIKRILLNKLAYFLELSAPLLQDDLLWKKLEERYGFLLQESLKG